MNELRFMVVFALLLALVLGGCGPKESVQLNENAALNENATYEEIIHEAVKMNDAGICSRFSNMKPVTLVANNMTLAKDVDMGCAYESGCIRAVALSARDTELCKKMRKCSYLGDFARDSCVRDVESEKVQDVAMKGDYRDCINLKGTIAALDNEVERKELCLHYLAINQSSPDVCEMIEKSGTLRDTCFFSVTNLEKPEDAAICQKIKSEYMKSICLQQYEQTSRGNRGMK